GATDSWAWDTGLSSKKAWPLLSTTTVTNLGGSPGLAPSVLGRSSRIELASSGAVMMKITTSTSITSTSGVTLMSLMGSLPLVRSSLPNAMGESQACAQQHAA